MNAKLEAHKIVFRNWLDVLPSEQQIEFLKDATKEIESQLLFNKQDDEEWQKANK